MEINRMSKYLIALYLSVYISGCVAPIDKEGIVLDPKGKQRALSDNEIAKLDTILKDGLVKVKGKKWKHWKRVKIKRKNKNKIVISVYFYIGGYLKFNNEYFRVRDTHLDILEELFGSDFKRKCYCPPPP